jgi:hypothetical protein
MSDARFAIGLLSGLVFGQRGSQRFAQRPGLFRRSTTMSWNWAESVFTDRP